MNLSSKFNLRKRKPRLRWTILAFLGYIGTLVVVKEIKTLIADDNGQEVSNLKKINLYNSENILGKLNLEVEKANLIPMRAILEDDSSTVESTEKSSTSSTKAPNRDNCTAPAIEQFPRPLMTPEARKSGALIVHILATIYLFIAIAIVCDEYFVPSLEMICDRMEMSEDVAGATFMAAGSSAPELATALIAVFVAKDDIGISGVIGSAVFNILFVISVCALFAGHVVELNWWPLVRDCVCYCFSICGLLLAIYNEKVTWYKSLFLLILYVCYIVLMVYNRRMEEWANTLNVPFKKATREEKSSLFGNPTGGGANGEIKDPNIMTNSGGPIDGQGNIGLVSLQNADFTFSNL